MGFLRTSLILSAFGIFITITKAHRICGEEIAYNGFNPLEALNYIQLKQIQDFNLYRRKISLLKFKENSDDYLAWRRCISEFDNEKIKLERITETIKLNYRNLINNLCKMNLNEITYEKELKKILFKFEREFRPIVRLFKRNIRKLFYTIRNERRRQIWWKTIRTTKIITGSDTYTTYTNGGKTDGSSNNSNNDNDNDNDNDEDSKENEDDQNDDQNNNNENDTQRTICGIQIRYRGFNPIEAINLLEARQLEEYIKFRSQLILLKFKTKSEDFQAWERCKIEYEKEKERFEELTKKVRAKYNEFIEKLTLRKLTAEKYQEELQNLLNQFESEYTPTVEQFKSKIENLFETIQNEEKRKVWWSKIKTVQVTTTGSDGSTKRTSITKQYSSSNRDENDKYNNGNDNNDSSDNDNQSKSYENQNQDNDYQKENGENDNSQNNNSENEQNTDDNDSNESKKIICGIQINYKGFNPIEALKFITEREYREYNEFKKQIALLKFKTKSEDFQAWERCKTEYEKEKEKFEELTQKIKTRYNELVEKLTQRKLAIKEYQNELQTLLKQFETEYTPTVNQFKTNIKTLFDTIQDEEKRKIWWKTVKTTKVTTGPNGSTKKTTITNQYSNSNNGDDNDDNNNNQKYGNNGNENEDQDGNNNDQNDNDSSDSMRTVCGVQIRYRGFNPLDVLKLIQAKQIEEYNKFRSQLILLKFEAKTEDFQAWERCKIEYEKEKERFEDLTQKARAKYNKFIEKLTLSKLTAEKYQAELQNLLNQFESEYTPTVEQFKSKIENLFETIQDSQKRKIWYSKIKTVRVTKEESSDGSTKRTSISKTVTKTKQNEEQSEQSYGNSNADSAESTYRRRRHLGLVSGILGGKSGYSGERAGGVSVSIGGQGAYQRSGGINVSIGSRRICGVDIDYNGFNPIEAWRFIRIKLMRDYNDFRRKIFNLNFLPQSEDYFAGQRCLLEFETEKAKFMSFARRMKANYLQLINSLSLKNLDQVTYQLELKKLLNQFESEFTPNIQLFKTNIKNLYDTICDQERRNRWWSTIKVMPVPSAPQSAYGVGGSQSNNIQEDVSSKYSSAESKSYDDEEKEESSGYDSNQDSSSQQRSGGLESSYSSQSGYEASSIKKDSKIAGGSLSNNNAINFLPAQSRSGMKDTYGGVSEEQKQSVSSYGGKRRRRHLGLLGLGYKGSSAVGAGGSTGINVNVGGGGSYGRYSKGSSNVRGGNDGFDSAGYNGVSDGYQGLQKSISQY